MAENKNLLETVGENIFDGKVGVQTALPFLDVEAMSKENKERMRILGVDEEWVDTLEGLNWAMINPFGYLAGGAAGKAFQGARSAVKGGLKAGKSLWGNIFGGAKPVTQPSASIFGGTKSLKSLPRIMENIRKGIDNNFSPNLAAKEQGFKLIDETLASSARSTVSKELLSDESFNLWRKMMAQPRLNTLAKMEELQVPKALLNTERSRLYKGFDRKTYEETVRRQLDAPIYAIPDEAAPKFYGKGWKPNIGGWYHSSGHVDDLTGAIFIPESQLGIRLTGAGEGAGKLHTPLTKEALKSLKSTLVHEVKHSAQSPWFENMDKAYDILFKGHNLDWRKYRQAARQMQNVFKYPHGGAGDPAARHAIQEASQIPKLDKFQKYLLKPEEVSARLSEIRAGISPGRAKSNLFEIFNPDKLDYLLKTVWGAVPAVTLTDTERLEKVFGEKE